MTNPSNQDLSRQRAPGARGHIAGMIALVAFFVAVAAWFWTTRQAPQADAGFSLPHGIIVVGAGTFIAALIAEIRAMSFFDVLEMVWELVLGVFSVIGSILKGIWNGILGLFGWH